VQRAKYGGKIALSCGPHSRVDDQTYHSGDAMAAARVTRQAGRKGFADIVASLPNIRHGAVADMERTLHDPQLVEFRFD
jgi:hypothetical protein